MVTNKTPLSEDRFTQVSFAVIVVLVAAGVVGVWSMSSSLGRLEERVAIWTRVYGDKMDSATLRIDGLARDQRDSDRRIGALEGVIQAPVPRRQ